MEHVNHPKHYNSHPNGIECIDIIRHYTCDIANAIKYLWRAGLKPEMGKEDAAKEMEDLEKALWYIEDYKKNKPAESGSHVERRRIGEIVREVTGHDIYDIADGYEENIATAMRCLLRIGIIRNGEVRRWTYWDYAIDKATSAIQKRILDIDVQLLNKEIDNIEKVADAFSTGHPLEAVDGEDYISKPGCIRETEPEHYDPLNMIVVFGRVYCLTDEVRKKPNGALYTPCENCKLRYECNYNNDDNKHSLRLCDIYQAEVYEYFREVGVAKYSPRFGTVEVVDEMKELDLEMKKAESELNELDEALKEED